VPMATGRHRPTWVTLPPYHCSGQHRGSCRPLHFSPPTIRPRSSLLCSARATASPAITHRCQAAPEQSDQTKRCASSLRPSCTKSLPVAPACVAGPWDFPRCRPSLQAPHRWQPSPIVPPPRRPCNKLRATKELLPDHFSGRLDHSFTPSLTPPPRRHTHRHRSTSLGEHPLPAPPRFYCSGM
jgi:hypothetical protein